MIYSKKKKIFLHSDITIKDVCAFKDDISAYRGDIHLLSKSLPNSIDEVNFSFISVRLLIEILSLIQLLFCGFDVKNGLIANTETFVIRISICRNLKHSGCSVHSLHVL